MTALAVLALLFVKSALVLAVAAAITAAMRQSSAAARHAVWSGAIIATLALPVLSVALPPIRLTLVRDAIEWVLPASAPASSLDAYPGSSQASDVVTGSGEAPSADASDGLPVSTTQIIAVWMLGVLLFGARRAIAEIRARYILRRASPVANERLVRLFATVGQTLGVRQAVELRSTREIASPAVIGVIHPVILLPAAAETWEETDVTAVLVHELGHVARRDCLTNALVDLATVLYWCNPVVRLAMGRMREESERACDDRVVRGGAEPEAYANLLLRLTHAGRADAELQWSVTGMARPRELESRLRAILDARVSRRPLPAGGPMAFAALGIIAAMPTASLALRDAPASFPEIAAPEPDLLGDSVAGPASELVALSPTAYRLSPAAMRAAQGPDSALTRRLVAALNHEPVADDDLIRDRAAWALAQVRDGRLVDPLLESLNASDWRVQAYAAWALATARDPRAVPDLLRLMRHPVWRMRAMAAYALRESGDDRAVSAMHRALTDVAWQVRVEAVRYFGARGGPGMSERLEPRLGDRHIAVRRAAENALIL